MSDRDPFGLVLLLLWLKGELNEELLQFLVTVVDTELLKAATHSKKHKKTRHRVTLTVITFKRAKALTKIINSVPVILEDLKAIDVQQANDRVMLVGVVLLEKHSTTTIYMYLKGKILASHKALK